MPGGTPPPATPPPGPGPLGYQAPSPPPGPRAKKTNWLGIAVLIGIVVAIGGGFWLFRDRLSGNVTDLAVGDCFDRPGAVSEVEDVQHQPCTSPHDAEVIVLITDSATGAYPGTDHFRQIALSQCVSAATAYMGTDFNNRLDVDMGWFYPTEDGWDDGDRGVTCYLYQIDNQKLAVSLRNVGASPLATPSP
jgi:hypothetical protein